ncbi:Protein gir2 [Leucoagaricus gongylophorus]
MASDVLAEELEVLGAIYPAEFTKLSDTDIQIDAESEEVEGGVEPLKISLKVHYTIDYPQTIPELSLKPIETYFTDKEIDELICELQNVGRENVGIAMTFTLVSHLREHLSRLLRTRMETRKKEEEEKECLELEAEAARTCGTLVTQESFLAWRVKHNQKIVQKKAMEDEEKFKALTPKEREEYKKHATRLSGMRSEYIRHKNKSMMWNIFSAGRQLFERNRHLEDESLMEEGTDSVDASQYDRMREEQGENEGITFSDSD